MFTISDRIKALMVGRRLRGDDTLQRHPRLMLEITSGNVLNRVHVAEVFSDQINTKLHEMLEDNIIPIDNVLGLYSPSRKEITIYVEAIKLVAKRLGLNADHVEHIVKLHEYAHAVFHLGTESSGYVEDIDQFVSERTSSFLKHSEPIHEWIAQQLTYSTLCHESREPEKVTFVELMNCQPDIYRIDLTDFDGLVSGGDDHGRSQMWIPVLEAIREGKLNPLNPNVFDGNL